MAAKYKVSMVTYLNKWLIIIVLFVTVTSFSAKKFHPFFVSVTEIQHNAEEKTLEVSCKIFTDDFEKALRQAYKTNVDLLNGKDKLATNKLINEYLKKHLQITVDGKLLQLQFVGYEKEEEAIWSHFQVNDITSVKKIEIMDDILFEYKKEQVNLLHVKVNGSRKSTKLNNPESKVVFEW